MDYVDGYLWKYQSVTFFLFYFHIHTSNLDYYDSHRLVINEHQTFELVYRAKAVL